MISEKAVLGPGVLTRRGLTVDRQKPVCFEYGGISSDDGVETTYLNFSASPRGTEGGEKAPAGGGRRGAFLYAQQG
jgi:hypothetical protein